MQRTCCGPRQLTSNDMALYPHCTVNKLLNVSGEPRGRGIGGGVPNIHRMKDHRSLLWGSHRPQASSSVQKVQQMNVSAVASVVYHLFTLWPPNISIVTRIPRTFCTSLNYIYVAKGGQGLPPIPSVAPLHNISTFGLFMQLVP